VDERESQLERARWRLEILDGLLCAFDRQAEIDALIWNASDADEAHRLLVGEPFSFDASQAHHILDMALRLRTAAGRARLAQEAAELRAMLE
jgi:DNA gyrase/topoisomerase IV subunit A